jgi:hypothetical protein
MTRPNETDRCPLLVMRNRLEIVRRQPIMQVKILRESAALRAIRLPFRDLDASGGQQSDEQQASVRLPDNLQTDNRRTYAYVCQTEDHLPVERVDRCP